MKSQIIQKYPIVYFGRLVKSKGVETIIEAVYILARHQMELVPPLWIVGGNFNEIGQIKGNPNYVKMISFLEKNNLLFWWGQLPHEILPYVLYRCSIFCFTSKYEPGGRTILEAMASGLVVLASPHGLAEEIIQDGYNGFIVKNNTPKSWAKKLEFILQEPDLCKMVGEQSRQTIKNKFSNKHFQEKHWNIYHPFLS